MLRCAMIKTRVLAHCGKDVKFSFAPRGAHFSFVRMARHTRLVLFLGAGGDHRLPSLRVDCGTYQNYQHFSRVVEKNYESCRKIPVHLLRVFWRSPLFSILLTTTRVSALGTARNSPPVVCFNDLTSVKRNFQKILYLRRTCMYIYDYYVPNYTNIDPYAYV